MKKKITDKLVVKADPSVTYSNNLYPKLIDELMVQNDYMVFPENTKIKLPKIGQPDNEAEAARQLLDAAAKKYGIEDTYIQSSITHYEPRERLAFNTKKYLDNKYAGIGGLEGLKKAREEAGLQTSLPVEWYEKMGYSSPTNAVTSTFDVIEQNPDATTNINFGGNNPLPSAYALYNPMTDEVIMPDYSNLKYSENDESAVLDHEMLHQLQIQKNPNRKFNDLPNEVHAALRFGLEPDFNYKQYYQQAHELQAIILQEMSKYQGDRRKALVTPQDFEDFYEANKSYFESLGYPKSHVLKIAPTLAYNEEQPKTLWG